MLIFEGGTCRARYRHRGTACFKRTLPLGLQSLRSQFVRAITTERLCQRGILGKLCIVRSAEDSPV
jgi:hypothetical protein